MKKLLLLCISGILLSSTVNADYTRNIDDEIKINAVEVKIENILKKLPEDKGKKIKKQVKQKIQTMLQMDSEEIMSIKYYRGESYESFQQYLLLRIYRQLQQGRDFFGKTRVVENNYVKALVFGDKEENILVTHDGIYSNIGDLGIMTKFYRIPEGMTAESFIYKEFVKELYSGKCDVSMNDDAGRMRFWISAYGEYKKALETPEAASRGDWMGACGDYGQTNGAQYFELLSDKVLMFAAPGQGGIPVDLPTIEVKKNIKITEEKQVKDFGDGLILKVAGKKSFMYKKQKLLFVSSAIEDATGVVQVESGQNGIYILEGGENGFSRLIMFDQSGYNKRILKIGNPDAGEGKTIKKFELLINKKIKLFFYGTDESQIIGIE